MNTEKKAVVIVELKNNKIVPATFEAIECAYRLSGSRQNVHAIVLARDADLPAQDLAKTGVSVLSVFGKNLFSYNCELFKKILAPVIEEISPAWVCMPHTSFGMDLGPGLAIGLGASYIPGVEQINPDANEFVRPAYNGKFSQTVRPDTDRVVCTLLPGSFSFDDRLEKPGQIQALKNDEAPEKTRLLGMGAPDGPDLSLAQADTIVCAGRGMGNPENLELIRRVAALFARSAVAGSRIACDLGWLSYKHQVGVTGQTVAPRLYIACGVSGAFQHVAGMRGSQLVVAINTDPNAPIFKKADFCIKEDAMAFLPVFADKAKDG